LGETYDLARHEPALNRCKRSGRTLELTEKGYAMRAVGPASSWTVADSNWPSEVGQNQQGPRSR
jgi:hypothetical protein